MILALEAMDPVVAGILFLIAVVLFVLAAFGFIARLNLIALGLAFCAVVWMWQQFAVT